MMAWPTRTHNRLASITLLMAVGVTSVAAQEKSGEQSPDIAVLAKSVKLDPKLSRCTVSKERQGKGVESLMKALKDGKPPVVARAIHRWKQKRMSGETRQTPKFVFGAKTGSDKQAKLAIMSDQYDSLAWGPTFDEAGGKKLYEKLGKAVDCKCDTPLDGKLEPMLSGLRRTLEFTGKSELISWGEKFTAHDLAAVAQHVIATQEPQEGEISDGVKLEVGLQTYATRELFGYMHPVYDPEANSLSCQKLEDSVPVSTEFQLYVALTGLEQADEAELAEAATGQEPEGETAQGDADLAEAEDEFGDGDRDLAATETGEAAEEQDVAALQTGDDAYGDDADRGQEVSEAIDEDFREADEDGRQADVDEESYEAVDEDEPVVSREVSAPSPRRSVYRNLRDDDYDEERYEAIDRGPTVVVEDIEDDVDDWYDYPGYYDDYDVVTIYREPPPPVIILRPAVVTPVVAIFGGAIVFAAVTRPRWRARPWWWGRPGPWGGRRPWARNNVNVNINFFRPRRARGFRPGWGLRQNRGFVRRTPRNFVRRGNRIIPVRANLGPRRGVKGRPGFWKAKRRNARANAVNRARINKGLANRKALARRKATARRSAGQKNAVARRKAAIKNAAARKAAARKKAGLPNNPAARKAAARKAAARKAAARKNAGVKNAATQKKAAAKRTGARKNAAKKQKRVAAKNAALKRKNNANQAAARKRAAAQKANARKAAAQKRAAGKKATARKKAAAQRNAGARRKAAAQRKARASAAKRKAGQQRANAARRKAASKRKAAARRQSAARQNAAQNRRKAAARKNSNKARRNAAGRKKGKKARKRAGGR